MPARTAEEIEAHLDSIIGQIDGLIARQHEALRNLDHIAAILRAFYLAPQLSIASLQMILDLAVALNPELAVVPHRWRTDGTVVDGVPTVQ
jgi:hypothetical protein